jgi:hypothetical protein
MLYHLILLYLTTSSFSKIGVAIICQTTKCPTTKCPATGAERRGVGEGRRVGGG